MKKRKQANEIRGTMELVQQVLLRGWTRQDIVQRTGKANSQVGRWMNGTEASYATGKLMERMLDESPD